MLYIFFFSKRQSSSATLGILLDYITDNRILSVRQAGCDGHYLQTEFSKGWSVCVNSGWGNCFGERFSLRSSDRRDDLQALDSHSPALVRHESGQGLCVLSCLKVYLRTRKREREKNLCKLNSWTILLFPQPVQRGKYYVNGHLISLKVTSLEFSNMGSMLANLASRWHLLQQPSPNSVFGITSPCFILCLQIALLLLHCSPHLGSPPRSDFFRK